MRAMWAFGFLFLAGCSTAPVAGLMDCLLPSRLNPDRDYPTRPDRLGGPPPRDLGGFPGGSGGTGRGEGPLPPDVYPRDSRNPILDAPIPVPPPGQPLPRN